MGGKAAILLVLGFSIIFLVFGQNFNRTSVSAVDNMFDYYENTTVHNIAVSAANMAARKIFESDASGGGVWTTGFPRTSFMGGYYTVNVAQNADLVIATSYAELEVDDSTLTNTVQFIAQPSKFSKFAYYSNFETMPDGSPIWWTNNDTVWGPFHTQDDIRCYRHPVFEYKDKVTSKGKLRYYTSKTLDKPIFKGQYESGVDLPRPASAISDMEAKADAGGLKFTGHDTVYVEFLVNGKMNYKFSYNGIEQKDKIIKDLAPNGVIFAKDAVLRIKGKVNGQFTIAASGSSGKGDVYLDDDITYNTNPLTDPSSTDLLGIVSENNVRITNNTANNTDINIHASIYTHKGSFGAEDYNTRPFSGNIRLLGGIQQERRGAVGTFGGYSGPTGFNKRYKYDNRLKLISPPGYPGTNAFEIVSWYE